VESIIIKVQKKISIVTPTFNEKDNIKNLVDSVSSQMQKFNYDYEHIIIDNCSTDKTQDVIKNITIKNKKVKAIFNTRNFGAIRSSHHAILQSTGDATILISSDLQEPVEIITDYIKYWEDGFDVVMGQRNSSASSFFLDKVKSIFYKFLNSVSEIKLIERSGSTALISKKIVDQFKIIDDPYPYFRGLIPELASNIKIVPYEQQKRLKGKSKNNFFDLYDMAMLGIVKHSKIPLRIFTIVGFFCSILSLVVAFIFLLYKIFFWSAIDVGIAPIIIGLFGVASIQLFLLGFVGEYVMQILTHTRKMPLVIERDRLNF